MEIYFTHFQVPRAGRFVCFAQSEPPPFGCELFYQFYHLLLRWKAVSHRAQTNHDLFGKEDLRCLLQGERFQVKYKYHYLKKMH